MARKQTRRRGIRKTIAPREEPLVFVLPERHDELSGGNRYNAHLAAALGARVRVTSIARFSPQDEPEGTFLLDTLNLDVMGGLLDQRRPGQRFVLLVHHLPSLEPGLSERHPSVLLEQALLPRFDGYIATGEFARQWLGAQGLAERTLLVEPAFETPEIEPRNDSDVLEALMAGNLLPRKGVLEFLEALGRVPQLPEGFQLTIAGRHDMDSAYAAACRAVLERSPALALRVALVGPRSHDRLLQSLRSCHLFLSASRMETYGIAMQEARHYGVPLLVVRGGNSANHVIQGQTGEVCESPEALAKRFVQLVGEPERLSHYGERALFARPKSSEWTDRAEEVLRALGSGMWDS